MLLNVESNLINFPLQLALYNQISMHAAQQEPTRNYFGDNCPAVSKTSALTIFSYFSNEDTYNASLVAKQWNEVAFDDELWQLE